MKPVPRPILLALALVTCGLHAAALMLPCLYVQDIAGFVAHSHDPVRGWVLLLLGPLGLVANVFAWYANLFLPAALVLLVLRKYGWAALAGVPCLLLALSSLLMREMIVDEAGNTARVTSHGPGFYFWLAACALPTVAAVVLLILTTEKAPAPE